MQANSTLADLLHHGAFDGFARRLLPWDGRVYDERLPLREIGSLLPYHSHVEVESTIPPLNHLIDDVAAGGQVFYDIYNGAEKRADPSKEHTGLFYLRGRNDAPFCVIAPGGGFAYVASVHEGLPYAHEISRLGLNAFVLKYRAGLGARLATEDLARALSHVFENAASLGVATAGYSLWGSSAGARMAAAVGSQGPSAFGGVGLPKPSSVIMAYTGHQDHASIEPPTFAVVGERDGIAPPAVMARRIRALQAVGTDVEFHIFPGLEHGFGLGIGTSAQGWVERAVRFWRKQLDRKDAR